MTAPVRGCPFPRETEHRLCEVFRLAQIVSKTSRDFEILSKNSLLPHIQVPLDFMGRGFLKRFGLFNDFTES